MLIICRILAALLLALLAAGAALSQEPSQDSAPTGSPQQTQPQRSQQPTAPDRRGTDQSPLVVKIVPPPQAVEEPSQTKPAAKNEPAEYGWPAGLWPWFGHLGSGDKIATIAAFLGFLQFVALYLTLHVMRWSARQQLRAYVSGTASFVYSFDANSLPNFSFEMQNVGVTPAYAVTHRSEIVVCPEPLPPNYRFPRLSGEGAAPTVLFPNLPPLIGNKTASRLITGEEIGRIRAQEARIYVFGEIRYRDAFRRRRWTTFAMGVVADKATLGKLTSSYRPSDLKLSFQTARVGNDAN